RIATAANPGDFASCRKPYRKSCQSVCTGTPPESFSQSRRRMQLGMLRIIDEKSQQSTGERRYRTSRIR
ncbi:MAG: hypothetical protein WBX16_11665, partial [Candidatus Acidiferrales bacterium]